MSKLIVPPEIPRRKVKKIPIDRDRIKRNSEFFGRQFLQEIPTHKGGDIIYSVRRDGLTLDYRFNKAKSQQLRKILQLDKNFSGFSLGRRASRLWYSLIVLAAEQGSGTMGKFKVSDLIRLWEVKKSGRLYNDIKQTFLSLASFNPYFSNNKTGAEKIDWGYSYFDAWLIKGEGDNAEFTFELNKVALGITQEWLEDRRLSLSSLKSGYLSMPISDLKGKRDEPSYENFIERIRLLKSGEVTVLYSTILRDWIKVGDDVFRRRKQSHDLVLGYLQKAQDAQEIKGFTSSTQKMKEWRETWNVSIHK
jgi:hypothetical protein